MPLTHVIAGRPALRYLQHHHAGVRLNRTHAVDCAGLIIRDRATTRTLCGAEVTIQELPELVAADGGPVYNCRATADGKAVTCRDCKRKLD